MQKTYFFVLLFLITAHFPAQATSCSGQLVGINSGKGAVGLIFGLDESQDTATALSVGLFSSAAMAYDADNQRMYYTSAPRPTGYSVDTTALSLPADTLLPIKGNKFKYIKLAYYDVQTNTHTEVGRTKNLISMVYDAQSATLIGASYNMLYAIDPATGDSTELLDISSIKGKYRGDMAFYNDRLILVTSTHVYEVVFADAFQRQTPVGINLLSEHGLSSVAGAALNPQGDLVISRVIQNDGGHTNQSKLYKLLPDTGKTCAIGTVPVRLNDITFYDQGTSTCYTVDNCN
jgi:hypothetical protein